MKKVILSMLVIGIMSVLANAESCTSVGVTDKKYTPSGCDYKTETRTCCEDGTWSEWGKGCDGKQEACFNGSEWEAKPKEGYLDGFSSSNINMEAIRESGSGLADMIYSYPLKQSKVVGTVNAFRSGNCTCTSSGWKCKITFKYQLLETTIQSTGRGTESWESCDGSESAINEHLWKKYPDVLGSNGKQACSKSLGKITSDNLVSTCENLLSWAVNDQRDPSGRFSKVCGSASWSGKWHENHTGFRSSKCKLYDLETTIVGCTISNRQITKSSDDSGSWFGE